MPSAVFTTFVKRGVVVSLMKSMTACLHDHCKGCSILQHPTIIQVAWHAVLHMHVRSLSLSQMQYLTTLQWHRPVVSAITAAILTSVYRNRKFAWLRSCQNYRIVQELQINTSTKHLYKHALCSWADRRYSNTHTESVGWYADRLTHVHGPLSVFAKAWPLQAAPSI